MTRLRLLTDPTSLEPPRSVVKGEGGSYGNKTFADDDHDSDVDSLFDGSMGDSPMELESLSSGYIEPPKPVDMTPSSRLGPPIPGLCFDPSVLLPDELAESLLQKCMETYFHDENVNQVMLFERVIAQDNALSASSGTSQPIDASKPATPGFSLHKLRPNTRDRRSTLGPPALLTGSPQHAVSTPPPTAPARHTRAALPTAGQPAARTPGHRQLLPARRGHRAARRPARPLRRRDRRREPRQRVRHALRARGGRRSGGPGARGVPAPRQRLRHVGRGPLRLDAWHRGPARGLGAGPRRRGGGAVGDARDSGQCHLPVAAPWGGRRGRAAGRSDKVLMWGLCFSVACR